MFKINSFGCRRSNCWWLVYNTFDVSSHGESFTPSGVDACDFEFEIGMLFLCSKLPTHVYILHMLSSVLFQSDANVANFAQAKTMPAAMLPSRISFYLFTKSFVLLQ